MSKAEIEGILQPQIRKNAFGLPGSYETAGAVLGSLMANERFNRPDDYVATLKQKFEAVGLEQVQGAAEQILRPGQLTWVIIGDRNEIEDSLQALDVAEIEFMDADGNFTD